VQDSSIMIHAPPVEASGALFVFLFSLLGMVAAVVGLFFLFKSSEFGKLQDNARAFFKRNFISSDVRELIWPKRRRIREEERVSSLVHLKTDLFLRPVVGKATSFSRSNRSVLSSVLGTTEDINKIMTSSPCGFEDTITAGRTLELDKSVNGKGTKTISPFFSFIELNVFSIVNRVDVFLWGIKKLKGIRLFCQLINQYAGNIFIGLILFSKCFIVNFLKKAKALLKRQATYSRFDFLIFVFFVHVKHKNDLFFERFMGNALCFKYNMGSIFNQVPSMLKLYGKGWISVLVPWIGVAAAFLAFSTEAVAAVEETSIMIHAPPAETSVLLLQIIFCLLGMVVQLGGSSEDPFARKGAVKRLSKQERKMIEEELPKVIARAGINRYGNDKLIYVIHLPVVLGFLAGQSVKEITAQIKKNAYLEFQPEIIHKIAKEVYAVLSERIDTRWLWLKDYLKECLQKIAQKDERGRDQKAHNSRSVEPQTDKEKAAVQYLRGLYVKLDLFPQDAESQYKFPVEVVLLRLHGTSFAGISKRFHIY